jgi:tRNA/rRNA methyltransferase
MPLTEAELDRLTVVLVRARDPNNIGAVARAMHDFGFRDLRMVNDYSVSFERAKSAVDASAVLESAQQFATVAEAVAGATLVVGTTAVGLRRREQPIHTLAEAAGRLRAELAARDGASPPPRRLALLFGSEKTGLSNEELSHCHFLVTIPMYQTEGMRHPSMNLGQAVAVCLYELVRDPDAPFPQPPADPPLAADLERLTALLTEVMEATEYTRRHAANFDPLRVRQLIHSMNLDRSRTLAWTGILRQVLWKLRISSSNRDPADNERPEFPL